MPRSAFRVAPLFLLLWSSLVLAAAATEEPQDFTDARDAAADHVRQMPFYLNRLDERCRSRFLPGNGGSGDAEVTRRWKAANQRYEDVARGYRALGRRQGDAIGTFVSEFGSHRQEFDRDWEAARARADRDVKAAQDRKAFCQPVLDGSASAQFDITDASPHYAVLQDMLATIPTGFFTGKPYRLDVAAVQDGGEASLRISKFAPDPQTPAMEGMRLESKTSPLVYEIASVPNRMPVDQLLKGMRRLEAAKPLALLLESGQDAHMGEFLHAAERLEDEGRPVGLRTQYMFVRNGFFYLVVVSSYEADAKQWASWPDHKPDAAAEAGALRVVRAMYFR